MEENQKDVTPLSFTKEDLLLIYNIGFNTGRRLKKKNDGEAIVEVFCTAQERFKNIKWE